MAQNCTLPLPPCQVQNAVFDGMHVYEVQDIIKGQFAAVYATELEENEGLPFWIGKIHSKPESTVDSDEDEDEDDGESCNHFVEIEEYNQQPKSKNAKGQWSGVYKPLKVHGEKKAKSKTTTAKAVITTVPIEQIAYTFPELTASGMLNKTTKEWVSFRCEVASRLRVFDGPNVEAFNEACGFKTMPYE